MLRAGSGKRDLATRDAKVAKIKREKPPRPEARSDKSTRVIKETTLKGAVIP